MLHISAGKNRPLDEDELDFVNAVERSKAAAERAWHAEQDREMDNFREARAAAVCSRCAGRSRFENGVLPEAVRPTCSASSGSPDPAHESNDRAPCVIPCCCCDA